MRIARLRGSELSPNPGPQKQNDLPSAEYTDWSLGDPHIDPDMAMRRDTDGRVYSI